MDDYKPLVALGIIAPSALSGWRKTNVVPAWAKLWLAQQNRITELERENHALRSALNLARF